MSIAFNMDVKEGGREGKINSGPYGDQVRGFWGRRC